MSLNWNLTKVTSRRATGRKVADCNDDSHDSPCKKCPQVPEVLVHDAAGKPIPWAVTNGLIWATMAVQLPGMRDAKMAAEFAFRIAFYQRVFGAWLNSNGEPRPITTAEVLAHQGMGTNVSERTRGQFLKAMSEQIARDVDNDVRADVLKVLKIAAGDVAAPAPAEEVKAA